GEAHLDDIVERGFARDGAERAIVFVGAHGLERGVGVKHAAAAGAKHVPRHVEKPDLRGMQEGRDRPLLVETFAAGEGGHRGAGGAPRRRRARPPLARRRAVGVSRLAQEGEERMGFAHGSNASLMGRTLRSWVERFAHGSNASLMGRTLRSWWSNASLMVVERFAHGRARFAQTW